MAIGTNIRTLRTKKSISQRFLADQVGVAQSTIHNWESESSCPDGEEIKKLADALGIPVFQLFSERSPLKGIRQTRGNLHSKSQPSHPVNQLANYEELLSVQKELIQLYKSRVMLLEEENERLRKQLQSGISS